MKPLLDNGFIDLSAEREGNESKTTLLLINYLKDANCPTPRMTLFGLSKNEILIYLDKDKEIWNILFGNKLLLYHNSSKN
jgi:hypothetical protein